MDWQIKPLAKESTLSSQPFEIGERIVCFLYRNAEGELERSDVKESEQEQSPNPDSILGRWGRVVKDRQDEEREARQQVLASSEELFLSLFQNENDEESDSSLEAMDEDVEALKQILGLLLERKRIIKALEQIEPNIQVYVHVKSKEKYRVSTAELEPDQLLRIQESLNTLVL